MRFKTVLVISFLAFLCFPTTQSYAETFTLVKTIDLLPLLGDRGAIEVDVVANELYVANWIQSKYFRIDPVTGSLLGSFSLGSGILIDNHGSEYNPTTGQILHASDRDAGGSLSYDAFFATDANGVVTKGPYPLFGPGFVTNDPEGLTVDPTSGRVWVSLEPLGGGPNGIFEICPNNGTVINHLDVGSATALGFNPNSGKIFFADLEGVIKEVAPDGSALATVFDSGFGQIFGMAFTPSGDLVLLDFAPNVGALLPSQLLLYDSSYDADNVFTTSAPVPEFETTLRGAITEINNLPPSSFTNANRPIPLTNKINSVIAILLRAVNKLENDILTKMDGCETLGAPDNNDWIIDCDAQAQIYPILLEVIKSLEGTIGE